MKFGVVIFPGSNCDKDIIHVLKNVMQQEVVELWHKDDDLPNFSADDCVMIPGGFSYGDYLRPGAIANFSPIMKAVVNHANNGGYVWGICNGFQVLCESGLLPGVLMRNKQQKFICKNVYLKAENNTTAITSKANVGRAYKIPVAHADGNYFADQATLTKLNSNNQIIYRYCDVNGNVVDDANPNGSLENIAGICNERKNVFGMMPHPERASESVLGNEDGKMMFESLLSFVKQSVNV